MAPHCVRLLLLGIAGALAPGAALPAPAVPLEVYGRLPHLENLALSPDGTQVAFVKTDGDQRFIMVYGLASQAAGRGLKVGDQKLRSIRWADDHRLLITTSVTTVPWGFIGDAAEWAQMQVFDTRSGKIFEVPQPDAINGDEQLLNAVADEPAVRRIDGHTVLFVRGYTVHSGLIPALIRVDLDTQHTRVLKSEHEGSMGWVIDEAGEPAVEETWNDKQRRWTIFLRREGKMQRLAGEEQAIEFPRVVGWGPSGDSVMLVVMDNNRPVWKLLSRTDGSISPPLAALDDIEQRIEQPLTDRFIGGSRTGDSTEYVFFDPGIQNCWNAVLRVFPDEYVQLETATPDYRKVIVKVEGAKHGYGFVLIDIDAHKAIGLGPVYAGLTQPLPTRRITYAAADGLQIPAYLTLPRDRSPNKLPLIVLPHGGPEAHDTAEFDWWAQALAEQGYAVLRPNFRGSDLSWQFLSAGFGEWGRKMQTDLSDGVRYLAKEGVIDATRVCIVGGSYGGYAALAGVTLDPGVYRCAVSVAGISDLRRMLDWENERRGSKDSLAQRYWDRYMGVTGPKDPAVDAISPIRHVDAVSVPVLLIHGKDDTVVDFEQSRIMYEALRDKKKDVQLVVLRREDHWLSRSATRLQMLESSVAFLRTHNPPD
ncbi:MAG: S9 family peptidase [Gammaproteobacteria bacterium]|nr:S9 family peptidase [Gammaproteobacteria bacterium]